MTDKISFLARPEFLLSAPGTSNCICCEGDHCFGMSLAAVAADGSPLLDPWDQPYAGASRLIENFAWQKTQGRLLMRADQLPVFVPGDRPGDNGHQRLKGKLLRITVEVIEDTRETM